MTHLKDNTTKNPAAKKASSKRTRKKRPYTKDPMERISKGEPWTLPVKIDNDIASLILEEHGDKGSNYNRIINARLRKGYGAKAAKK